LCFDETPSIYEKLQNESIDGQEIEIKEVVSENDLDNG